MDPAAVAKLDASRLDVRAILGKDREVNEMTVQQFEAEIQRGDYCTIKSAAQSKTQICFPKLEYLGSVDGFFKFRSLGNAPHLLIQVPLEYIVEAYSNRASNRKHIWYCD